MVTIRRLLKTWGMKTPLALSSIKDVERMDDFPSYRVLLESLENGAINRSSTKNSSTKSYYTPHTSL